MRGRDAKVHESANGSDPHAWRAEEEARLQALRDYRILDTPREAAFDDLVELAVKATGCPVALINFLDSDREFFKAEIGLDARERPLTPDCICLPTLHEPDLLVIPDLREDPRYAGNPKVAGSPGYRFYAGIALCTEEGVPIGTFCTLDFDARPQGLTADQQDMLRILARMVMERTAQRREFVEAQARETRFRLMAEALPQMVWSADPQGRIVYSNQRCRAFIHGDPDDRSRIDWLDLVHPEDRTRAGAAWSESIKVGQALEVAYRFRHHGGEYRWILARALPVRDARGRIEHWFGTSTDIHETRAAQAELAMSEARYRALTEASALVVWRASADGGIIDTIGWQDITGQTPDLYKGDGWLAAVHPEDRERFTSRARARLPSDRPRSSEYRLRFGDGRYRWVCARAVPLFDDDGNLREWIGTVTDIHDSREAQRKLTEQGETLRITLENMDQGLLMVDHEGRIGVYNQRFLELLDIPEALVEGEAHFDDLTRHQMETGEIKLTEGQWPEWLPYPHEVRGAPPVYERVRPNGSVIEVRSVHLPGGGAVRTYTDVTETRRVEREMLRMARQDALTGLPNRFALHERLGQLQARGLEDGAHFGLMLLDIDNFKDLNDTLGHAAGDEILTAIAARIREVIPDDALAARLGGDEFAILLAQIDDVVELERIATRVVTRMRQPFRIEDRDFLCRASVGLAAFPDHGKDIDEIVKLADIALYAAKHAGRDQYAVYTPSLGEAAQKRVHTLRDARAALARDAIVPFYQPKIDLRDGSVPGFEALLRWRHPEGGLRSPMELAQAFADPELSVAIGERMLDRIIDDMRSWDAAGITMGTVALNIANAEFLNPRFADSVIEVLDSAGIAPQRLEVEVTENVFLGHGAQAVSAALRRFREAGIQVSLDDFGTGYASLTHLDQFPLNWVKLDMSFVSRVGKSTRAEAILEGTIKLAHSLGLGVVAEGIETREQLAFLADSGCELGQGYLFARPMAASRVAHFVKTGNEGPQLVTSLKPKREAGRPA
ncbi:MAG: EAL domain-containing protein [Salinarimonas sp.]|nr:EAL domain-containing protein [Salinarimonas sp.]